MFKENRIIGILGGGQLGKMVLDVANKWGLQVYILDSNENCPSSKLCSKFFQGDLMDFDTVVNFGKMVNILTIEIENVNVEINKQGWHTHTTSWIDPNAINSLNGKVILKKDIISNTFEVLSSVILHFIQSGANIKMDYNLIKDFIDQNPPDIDLIEIDVSHKEKKFIGKYIDNIFNKFNFDG